MAASQPKKKTPMPYGAHRTKVAHRTYSGAGMKKFRVKVSDKKVVDIIDDADHRAPAVGGFVTVAPRAASPPMPASVPSGTGETSGADVEISMTPEEYMNRLQGHLFGNTGNRTQVTHMRHPDVLGPLLHDAAVEQAPFAEYAPENARSVVEVTGPHWSSEQTRTMMGLGSRQALSGRRARHTILALPASDGGHIYPVWQFVRSKDETKAVVHPRLLKVLPLLGAWSPWQTALFLCAPLDVLDGVSPRDFIANSKDIDVLLTYLGGSATGDEEPLEESA